MPGGARIAALALITAVIARGEAALGATDWTHARPLTVIAADYQFSPKRLVFRHGAAYRLHLENRGKETHEFHAAEFFKAATLRDPGVLNPDRSEIVLQPGTKTDVDLIAPPPGHYPLYCPDHDWAGMTGEITVK